MKAETAIFVDAIAAMRDHARQLATDEMILVDNTPLPDLIQQRYGLSSQKRPANLIAKLHESALSAERWAGHVETALHSADTLSALAYISSAMTSVDRIMADGGPYVEPGLFQWLSSRLDPIYWRAVPVFNLGSEPPDNSRIDAYSRWLATHPNPWSA